MKDFIGVILFHKLVHILYFCYTGKVKLLTDTDHMGAVPIIRCFSVHLGNCLSSTLPPVLLNKINSLPALKSYNYSFPQFHRPYHSVINKGGQWGLYRLGDSGIIVHLLSSAMNLCIPPSLFDLYFPIFQIIIAYLLEI